MNCISRFVVTGCVLIAAVGSMGFRSFFNNGSGHFEITREALEQVSANRVLTVSFAGPALDSIARYSEWPDHFWSHAYAEEEHFDNESFENTPFRVGAPQKIMNDRAEVLRLARAGEGIAARQVLGYALHTIGDFYSHSTWIESRQGIAEHANPAAFALQVGDWRSAGCLSETANNTVVGGDRVTTTYYELEHSDPHPPFLRGSIEKCVHGGLTNWLGPTADKDDPDHVRHKEAAELAVLAIREFVQRIIDELEGSRELQDDRAVCTLLGYNPDACSRPAVADIEVWRLYGVNVVVNQNATFTHFSRQGGNTSHQLSASAGVSMSAGSSTVCREGDFWISKQRTLASGDETWKWSLDSAGYFTGVREHSHESETPQRRIKSYSYATLKANLDPIGPYSGESRSFFDDWDVVNGPRTTSIISVDIPARAERFDNNAAFPTMEKLRTLPAGSAIPRECTQ